MASLAHSIKKAMQIKGALGIALIDTQLGVCLQTNGGGTLDMELTAAGNIKVVQAILRMKKQLGLEGELEDQLITFSNQFHVLQPLAQKPDLFSYLILDKKTSNLALARMKLRHINDSLEL